MVAIQLAGLTAVTTLMIGPVLQSSFHMRMARQFSEQAAERPELAAEVGSIYYLKAASVDQLDPTPLIEHARLLTRLNQSPASLTRSIELLEKALARDPGNRTIHQNLAEVLRMRAKVSGNPADLLRALGFAESALALYPNSPNAHLMVADLHVDLAAAADTSADRAHHQAAALDHYNQAIALEDQKPASELRRWPVRVRDRVEQVRDSLSRTVSESASPQ
jgi:tetratricopeptide (TPR) repeat protein